MEIYSLSIITLMNLRPVNENEHTLQSHSGYRSLKAPMFFCNMNRRPGLPRKKPMTY